MISNQIGFGSEEGTIGGPNTRSVMIEVTESCCIDTRLMMFGNSLEEVLYLVKLRKKQSGDISRKKEDSR